MPVFEPVDTSLKFPEAEAKIAALWKDQDVFQQSLKLREGRPTWVFYEGPPTANGRPHPGHVLTRVVKDLFPRYKTMRGFRVPRKAGWDTHGLPVEIEVEKELGLSGKGDIEKYGVIPFVRKCMESVFKYTADWENLTEKIGFWIDLKDAYVTYHQSYVESVWWSLKKLFEKDLLYKGHKVLPCCPRCQTALSSHEVGLGYKDVEDPSVFVTFRAEDWEASKTSFLAWTTTPWTLPSNAGLAVKADTEYAHVKVGDETLIMAAALVEPVMGKLKHEVVKSEPGSALVGRRYLPLFDWWKGAPGEREKAWKVCAAEFVTLDTGAGIVHIAPAYGADDYALGQREGLPVIHLVGPDGRLKPDCGAFAGAYFKDADKDLIKDLRDRGLLLKRENYKHPYPHCWRCDAALILYAREGWFIRTTREIGRVIENNKKIQWLPEHIRDGRFGNFLETNIDWALSRERYWGTPLPIWVSEDGAHMEAVESLKDLAGKPGVEGLDAFEKAQAADPGLNTHLRVHKPWIDAVTYLAPDGKQRMKRTPEVIDCWYDSGAMPFAQWGYPHAQGSLDQFTQAFPADFISEAIDQTRGWFYSLLAESTLLFDSAPPPHPFKTCVVLGHVCDEKGEKMSKSKGNYIDPFGILAEEGADALRWFFYSSNHPWTSSRFSRGNVREAQKEFLLKLRNVYSFFVIYANIDGFDPSGGRGPDFQRYRRGGRPLPERGQLDRWILSELHQTTSGVRQRLDDYDIYGSAQQLNAFCESLSNWYLQRSRERFWRPWRGEDRLHDDDKDKLDAYWTLFECLVNFAKLIAPFVPFTADELWQNLVRRPLGNAGAPVPKPSDSGATVVNLDKFARVPESVHLADYPTADPQAVDCALGEEMALVREIVSLGRNVRAAQKLKVRLPLAKVVLVLADAEKTDIVRGHEEVLREALNVKQVEFARMAEQYVSYKVQPNFKLIGAKYRDLVPKIKQALKDANASHLKGKFDSDGCCVLRVDQKDVLLNQEEVEITIQAKEGYAAAGGRGAVVVLDTHLTPELEAEGFARELVNRIQNARKDLDLKYEQRINLAVKGSPRMEEVARAFGEYIRRETLATELRVGEMPEGWRTFDVDAEKEIGTLGLLAE
ncbi:MAG: isoleucine--tRNA ligase [Planctomycetota bacterium]|nr:isoleucine--tRNA ligase [Planctomycetota bacterium]